jgi:hypothetical protein
MLNNKELHNPIWVIKARLLPAAKAMETVVSMYKILHTESVTIHCSLHLYPLENKRITSSDS